MSDDESEVNLHELSDSMQSIHKHIEQLSHLSKHIYSRALSISQRIENPNLDLWTQPFQIHERAKSWAKKHLVARKCSLWQIHRTLLESAKKEKRVITGQKVKLSKEEGEIMELPIDEPISVWLVMGKLPRFFV